MISFVAPAYNEEKNLPILYNRIIQLMEKLSYDWELILIDDGSKDNTLGVCKELATRDKRVKFLSLSRNFGHQAALGAGLRASTGDAVISLDADLQDPPEVIDKMLKMWEKGHKIVYARRTNFRKDNVVKRQATRFYYNFLGRFSNVKIPRNVGDFRLVDRKVQNILNELAEKRPYWRGLVAWTGYEHAFVDYERPDRSDGDSGYTLGKLVKLGMDGILGFSFLPLRIGFLLGIGSMLLGGGFLTYITYDSVVNNTLYQGYKILVVVNFIFIGFLFILIWILGEYLGRVLNQVRNQPLYIIEESGNFDKQPDTLNN